jgi:hypothetical protein
VAIGQISSVTQSLGHALRIPATDAFIGGYHIAMLTAGLCLLAAAILAAAGLRSRRSKTQEDAACP